MKWVCAFLVGVMGCDSGGSVVDATIMDARLMDGAVLDQAVDAAVDATLDRALDAQIDAAPPIDATPPDLGPPESLRFNAVQAKGTHNSYHIEADQLFHPSHAYTHAPLDVQLEEHGVRQFELDVHARVEGGFNVLHLPIVDAETTCLAFTECLNVIKEWSDANPRHFPIMIWIEPKDELSAPSNGHVVNSVDRMPELDMWLRMVFPRHRIFTPADLRGPHASERAALAADGWPTLENMRGKVVFAMLDGGPHRDFYRDNTDDDRLIFVQGTTPDDPRAAIYKINNAESEDAQARVAEGFIVTSNVDSADGDPAENARSRAAALASGVHFLSSDFAAPQTPDDTNWLDIPGGAPVRCNPVTAPMDCTAEALEDL